MRDITLREALAVSVGFFLSGAAASAAALLLGFDAAPLSACSSAAHRETIAAAALVVGVFGPLALTAGLE